jgi:hypothetical protein
MGPVKRFLGMDIIPPHLSMIHISDSNYVKRILAKFNMEFCNPAKTPFEAQTALTKTSPDDEATDAEQYRAITGAIMHLAVYIRPDIMYTASKLAQFKAIRQCNITVQQNISSDTSKEEDQIITYQLPPSSSSPSRSNGPVGYSDASCAADPDDRNEEASLEVDGRGGSLSTSFRDCSLGLGEAGAARFESLGRLSGVRGRRRDGGSEEIGLIRRNFYLTFCMSGRIFSII